MPSISSTADASAPELRDTSSPTPTREGGELREAAVALAERGFRVHPCGEDKRPLTRWSQTATNDPAAAAKLWTRQPDALIAVATGGGLVVVDDDRGLADPDPSLAGTLTSRTRSRGHHHWYTSTEDIGCSVGVVAPGIDIRARGGFVIAPPSRGWSWLDASAPIQPLPAVLLAAIQRHNNPVNGQRRGFEPRTHVPAGQRHGYLLSFAGFLVANELAETFEDVVAETMEHAAQVCEPPDSEQSRRRHVEGIARWVLRAEAGR
jgi:hypothetical protein